MPNNVKNKLTIDGGEEIFAYLKSDKSDFDFNKIIPMPEYIYNADLSSDAEKILGEDYTWYGWRLKNWGTKWNAYSVEVDGDTITFETAWSGVPRIALLLCDRFGVSYAEYRYADEDFGNNVGGFNINNGYVELVRVKDGSKEAFDIAAMLRPDWVSNSENEEGFYYDEEKGIVYREIDETEVKE